MVRRRRVRDRITKKTTLMLRGGRVAITLDEFFQRIFWRSPELANEAREFCKMLVENEPQGFPTSSWKNWSRQRNISVGQFYNMAHGLLGAGIVEKRNKAYHISSGFMRELEQMLMLYSSFTGFESRLK
ncbi:MAG: hypothetical protein QW201_00850 [Thermoproteota archaeon]